MKWMLGFEEVLRNPGLVQIRTNLIRSVLGSEHQFVSKTNTSTSDQVIMGARSCQTGNLLSDVISANSEIITDYWIVETLVWGMFDILMSSKSVHLATRARTQHNKMLPLKTHKNKMTVFLHLKHLFVKVHDKIRRQHKSFQANSPTLTDCPRTHSGYFPEKIIYFKTFSGLWDEK